MRENQHTPLTPTQLDERYAKIKSNLNKMGIGNRELELTDAEVADLQRLQRNLDERIKLLESRNLARRN